VAVKVVEVETPCLDTTAVLEVVVSIVKHFVMSAFLLAYSPKEVAQASEEVLVAAVGAVCTPYLNKKQRLLIKI
jgi:hypothetical protein